MQFTRRPKPRSSGNDVTHNGFADSGFRTESTVVLFSTLAASGLALLRDIAVGRELGLGAGLDIWTLAIATTGFLASAFVTATSATVIPTLRRAMHVGHRYPYSAADVAGTAVVTATMVGLALGVLIYSGAEPAINALLPKDFPRGELRDVIRILAFTAVPGLVLRGVGGSILQASRHFATASMSPAIPAVVVLIIIVVRANSLEELSVVHGAGAVVESVVLIAVVLFIVKGSWKALRPNASIVRHLIVGAGPAFISGVAFSLNPVVDLVIASRLEPGDAGRLGLASRLTIAVAALAATALAAPALPRLVDALAEGGPPQLRTLLTAVLRRGVLLGVGSTAAIVLLTIPLGSMLFAGGRLTGGDAQSVAQLQMIYALTITPYIVTTVALRALHALARYRAAMVIGIAGCVANLIADLALAQVWGAAGIAVATTLVYSATGLAMVMVAYSDR